VAEKIAEIFIYYQPTDWSASLSDQDQADLPTYTFLPIVLLAAPS
jgi:hypothetical protein